MRSNLEAQFEHIVTTKNCACDTHIENVRAFFIDESTSKQNCLYDKCIVILCQGQKHGHLHGKKFIYNKENFLVMGAPNPLLCEASASKEEPILGVLIKLDIPLLQKVSAQLKFEAKSQSSLLPEESVVQTGKISHDMQHSINRLLSVLESEELSRVFGQDVLKEIYYHILKNKDITALDNLIDHTKQFTRMMHVIDHIDKNFDKPLAITNLAEMAHVSVPTFHRLFKKATDSSPIQFIKKVRLAKAKNLIEFQNMRVSQASALVGYENTSQFTREFKREYGQTPKTLKAG